MKKIILNVVALFAVAPFVSSCNNTSKEESSAVDSTEVVTDSVDVDGDTVAVETDTLLVVE